MCSLPRPELYDGLVHVKCNGANEPLLVPRGAMPPGAQCLIETVAFRFNRALSDKFHRIESD